MPHKPMRSLSGTVRDLGRRFGIVVRGSWEISRRGRRKNWGKGMQREGWYDDQERLDGES